ncbi:MAG: AAA family ATPase [Candidatus Gracilibacteria bacterium]|nr:AAA family ATPase [Candidatus Gracilibacteria bacterium]
MLLANKVIGHAKQVETLLTDYTTGNLSHAYLLHGPAQVGKFTLAKHFANLLQCENDFCGVCPVCKQFVKEQHLDTVFMHDIDGSLIKIEEIRELINHLANTVQSTYKLCLIERVERMTREAANSFLKILEEPSSNTIFLLTTDSVRLLLPTITSRCRLLRFSLVNDDQIVQGLPQLGLEIRNENKEVLKFGSGRPGKIINLLRDPSLFEQEKKFYLDLQSLFSKEDLVARFHYVEELAKDPAQIEIFLSQLLLLWRETLRNTDHDLHSNKTQHLLQNIRKVEEIRGYLKQSVNPRLALENLVLEG